MITQSLKARIETAQSALRDAEARLNEALAGGDAGHRADKVEVSEGVRDALSRLRAAKRKLVQLEGAFASDDHGAARTALLTAESELDRAIERIDVAVRSQKQWMTDGVEEAFDKLRSAKATLHALEKAILPEE